MYVMNDVDYICRLHAKSCMCLCFQMKREHLDELEYVENEQKIDSVQDRFPNDNLRLQETQVPSVSARLTSPMYHVILCEACS